MLELLWFANQSKAQEVVQNGHEYPIIYRNGDEFKVYKDNHGAPVACRKKIKLKLNELTLNPGDILYLYTDGFTEATDKDLKMFGHERMLDVLNDNMNESVNEMDKAVRGAISEFVGDAEQFDDITSFVLRYHGSL